MEKIRSISAAVEVGHGQQVSHHAAPAKLFSTSARMSHPWWACSSLRFMAGRRRITVPWVQLTSSLRSRQALDHRRPFRWPARCRSLRRVRGPPGSGRTAAANLRSGGGTTRPAAWRRPAGLLLSIISMAARPARAEMGLPPKVAACMPGRRLGAISALASMAAPVSPPQIALDKRHNVGRHADALVGEPVAGPPAAGLHLVENQEQFVLVGQFSQAGQEAVGRNADAALALDRLDHDRRRLVVDQPGGRLQVAEGRSRRTLPPAAPALVILGLGGGRGRGQGAAVEPALEGDDLVAALGRAVQPHQLDGRLVGLGAGVAEKRLPAEAPLARGPWPTALATRYARCWGRGSTCPTGRAPPRPPAGGNGPAGCIPSRGTNRDSGSPRCPTPRSLRRGPRRRESGRSWRSRNAGRA